MYLPNKAFLSIAQGSASWAPNLWSNPSCCHKTEVSSWPQMKFTSLQWPYLSWEHWGLNLIRQQPGHHAWDLHLEWCWKTTQNGRASLNSWWQGANNDRILEVRLLTDISLDNIPWKFQIDIFNISGDMVFWNVMKWSIKVGSELGGASGGGKAPLWGGKCPP